MKMVPLGSILRPAKPTRSGSVAYPVFSMTMHDGLVPQSEKFNKKVSSLDTSPYKVVQAGQFVVGFPIDEAVLDYSRHKSPFIVSPAYGIWDADQSVVNLRYLALFLRSKLAISYYKAKLRGSTARRRSLPRPVFEALPVPLPSLTEQRRIADILDRATLIAVGATRRGELLDELHKGLFLDSFGDAVPSGETLESIIHPGKNRIRTGPFGSQLLKSEITESGPVVLGIDSTTGNEFNSDFVRHISAEKFKTLTRYQVFPGDVLITIMGTLGRTAIVPRGVPDAINTKHMVAITPDTQRITSEFLQDWLRFHPFASGHLGRSTRGAIMAGLNMGLVKTTPIAVPPLVEQQRYSSRLDHLRAFRASVRVENLQIQSLVGALQERAFKGEL